MDSPCAMSRVATRPRLKCKHFNRWRWYTIIASEVCYRGVRKHKGAGMPSTILISTAAYTKSELCFWAMSHRTQGQATCWLCRGWGHLAPSAGQPGIQSSPCFSLNQSDHGNSLVKWKGNWVGWIVLGQKHPLLDEQEKDELFVHELKLDVKPARVYCIQDHTGTVSNSRIICLRIKVEY